MCRFQQKINKLGVQFERMQRDFARFDRSPYRLLSTTYAHHVIPLMHDDSSLHDPQSSTSQPTQPTHETTTPTPTSSLKIKPTPTLPKLDPSFAQRYIDEIAPTKKLKEYEAVAATQKEKLFQEAKSLHQKFNQELAETYHMEHTVSNITSLVTEFSSMIEGQSESIAVVGEVAKDVTSSVELTDEELLKTLERSQKHQLNMVALIIGLGLLLLLLHFISP